MIKCPNCGFSNDDNCTFCAICGSSVTQNDFYVHNTASTDFSVEELTKKLISKDKQENAKTKSFKKLDKATLAKEAAKIEIKNDKVKEYKTSSESRANKVNNTEDDVKIKNKPELASNNTANSKDTKPVTDKENKNEIKKTDKNTVTTTDKKIVTDNNSKQENEKAYKKTEDKDKTNHTKTDVIKEAKEEDKINTNTGNKQTDENIKKSEPEVKEKTASIENYQDSKLYNLLSKFFFDTKNETALFKQDDIDENCNLAMISYIPFLFFVPIIIKPCSGYLRYHGIQGLTMFLSFIVFEFFDIILSAICNSIFNDMVGMLLTVIITVAINLAVLLLISIGIANAVKGVARELPIIGRYKFLKPYIY